MGDLLDNELEIPVGNENCLSGMRCPKCGSFEPFSISGTACFKVWDDGSDEFTQGPEWDEDSVCSCSCGYQGTVKDFQIQAQDVKVFIQICAWVPEAHGCPLSLATLFPEPHDSARLISVYGRDIQNDVEALEVAQATTWTEPFNGLVTVVRIK